MSELTQRLREWADEELTTTTCFLAFGELSDNGRIHEQRYRDLLAAADALEAAEEALDTATLYGDCATFRVRRNRALERIRGTLLTAPPEVKP